jgi:hypothetical protein
LGAATEVATLGATMTRTPPSFQILLVGFSLFFGALLASTVVGVAGWWIVKTLFGLTGPGWDTP